MFKITEDNYSYYKKLYEVVMPFMFPNLTLESLPDISKWEVAVKKKSLIRKGLQEALGDFFGEFLNHMPESMRKKIDESLVEQGFPSLNRLTATVKAVPEKVLKREKIKNISEYYIIKAVLDDTASGLSDDKKIKLGTILLNFEQKK